MNSAGNLPARVGPEAPGHVEARDGRGRCRHFGFVADRFDKDAPPHVQSWLPAPRGAPTARKIFAAFSRSVLAQTGYYAHLTAFWYLVDEDVATNGWIEYGLDSKREDRNLAYIVLGLSGLYASGCFWADTGG